MINTKPSDHRVCSFEEQEPYNQLFKKSRYVHNSDLNLIVQCIQETLSQCLKLPTLAYVKIPPPSPKTEPASLTLSDCGSDDINEETAAVVKPAPGSSSTPLAENETSTNGKASSSNGASTNSDANSTLHVHLKGLKFTQEEEEEQGQESDSNENCEKAKSSHHYPTWNVDFVPKYDGGSFENDGDTDDTCHHDENSDDPFPIHHCFRLRCRVLPCHDEGPKDENQGMYEQRQLDSKVPENRPTEQPRRDSSDSTLRPSWKGYFVEIVLLEQDNLKNRNHDATATESKSDDSHSTASPDIAEQNQAKMPKTPTPALQLFLQAFKKAFDKVAHEIIKLLITSCEWPIFPKECNRGKKFKDVYQLNEKIKSGAYATVCKASHRQTGHKYAVKCIQRSKLSNAEEIAIMTEISIMSSLTHHNIISLVDFFEQSDYFLLVMEFCEGGDLFDRIGQKKGYNERDARDLCTRVLEAIKYCHEDMGVAHCDLKPRNLLLRCIDDDSYVKLADFGFATRVTAPKSLTRQCGTAFYIAPEILKREPYDQSADMWSLGIIIYVLLGGRYPFTGKKKRDIFQNIIRAKFDFPHKCWSHVSDDAKSLIRELLTADPNQRLNAGQALQSRWIQGVSGDILAKNDLSATSEELKTFNAKLKFQSVARVVALVAAGGWLRRATATDEQSDQDGEVSEVDSDEEGITEEEEE